MVREFEYKGEVFRVNYHGISGHEEIIIVHLEDRVMEEGGEISIDRMTEENDTSAPIEDIIVMLCDQLSPACGLQLASLTNLLPKINGTRQKLLPEIHGVTL